MPGLGRAGALVEQGREKKQGVEQGGAGAGAETEAEGEEVAGAGVEAWLGWAGQGKTSKVKAWNIP